MREFLKIHYKGVTVLPGDEADGCEPDVSPFEIALQSWQTFNLAYNETHDPIGWPSATMWRAWRCPTNRRT